MYRNSLWCEIGIAILKAISEWQRNKVDWSGKNADFSTLIGCHCNVLEKSKKLNGVIKPFHLSTNPEILVKIGPLASEPAGLRRRPLPISVPVFQSISDGSVNEDYSMKNADFVTLISCHGNIP